MTIKQRTNPDGSVTTEMELGADTPMREVHDDVVDVFDNTLSKFGGEVMHAMDPRRIIDFHGGGPPVWSVGMVRVAGPVPHTLFLTYGFSEILSPGELREGVSHEYSIAIAGDVERPWGDAFLRYVTRYVLDSRADVRVNDIVPLIDRSNGRYIPMTRAPFPPQFHAQLPDSNLVAYACAADPVMPTIRTPHGEVEVRRIVGLDPKELDRAETWDAKGFLEEMRAVNPQLVTMPVRKSAMDDAAFRARVDARFDSDGSTIDALTMDIAWSVDEGRGGKNLVSFEFPTGAARERLCNALLGRTARGRRLVMFTPSGLALELLVDPNAGSSRIQVDGRGNARITFGADSEERGELIAAARTDESLDLVLD